MSADQMTTLREDIDYVESELAAIHAAAEGRALDGDEQTRWDEGTAYVTEQRKVLADVEARVAMIERIESGKTKPRSGDLLEGTFQHLRKRDTVESVVEDRAATPAQITDAVTRQIESYDIDPSHARMLLKRHRSDMAWSRNILARSTDVYAAAFDKFLTGREMLLTNEERAALAVGTNTQGGFLVPTHLDPSIILTNDGSSNALRPISRVVTLTEGNTWNGVSSAGVTASWDAELAEVSDDSPSVANPSIPIYKGAAFVQASFEAFQDISGLASDVMMMFGDAKDRLEGAAHCTGSGS
jgi:HK97 family phage major capsid protein